MLNSIQCCCGRTLEMRLKGIGTLYASFGGMREGFCSLMGYCKWVHSESGYGGDFDGLVVVRGKREKIEMGFGFEGVFGGLGEGEQEVVPIGMEKRATAFFPHLMKFRFVLLRHLFRIQRKWILVFPLRVHTGCMVFPSVG